MHGTAFLPLKKKYFIYLSSVMAMVLVRDCGPEKEMTRAILMAVGWDCGTCDRDSTVGCQGIQTEGSSSCSYGPVPQLRNV